MTSTPKPWHVYILLCKDNSLYTGITTDLPRRLRQHNTTTDGAKYTRGRRPVTLVYTESFPTRSLASRREHVIKRMTADKKRQLISSQELEIDTQ